MSSREPKPKVDAEVKGIEEVTKQHESKKDAKKQVKPKAVKEEVKKDAKSEAKPHAKDEAKKESKSDVKVSVKSDRSHTEDRRKRTTVEPRESRRSYPAPKRRKSRSRSPVARRTQSRRSRSRSPPRRVRRPRSRSRSRSPYHRKRSRSPIVLKRPLTPPKSPKIDKAQLLEFARQNLKRMQVINHIALEDNFIISFSCTGDWVVASRGNSAQSAAGRSTAGHYAIYGQNGRGIDGLLQKSHGRSIRGGR